MCTDNTDLPSDNHRNCWYAIALLVPKLCFVSVAPVAPTSGCCAYGITASARMLMPRTPHKPGMYIALRSMCEFQMPWFLKRMYVPSCDSGNVIYH